MDFQGVPDRRRALLADAESIDDHSAAPDEQIHRSRRSGRKIIRTDLTTMAQRFEGKNLDEALTMASEAFGVDRVQLTYHVVLEKKGFLGGFKRVVVEAEVNERPIAATVQEAAAPAPRSGRPSCGGGGGGR